MTINKTKSMMVSPAVNTPRKRNFWGATPKGRHSKKESVAILTVLRDYLGIADKEREVTRILNSGLVKLDGKVVKERRFGVGFMDLVTVDQVNANYRILYDRKGRLSAVADNKNTGIKLVKVTGKKSTGKGTYSITFHDGQNVLTQDASIKPNDVLVISVPDKKIDQILKLGQGARVFMTGGLHVGETGTIKSIEVKESSQSNLVTLEEGFSTTIDNVFVIGNSNYSFDLGEGGSVK